jgi:hypothetical protein
MKRIAFSLLLSMLLVLNNARASEYEISPFLAVIPGYAAGHFLEGRYQLGLLFTAVDAAALLTSIYIIDGSFRLEQSAEQERRWQLSVILGIALIAAKVWQIVDVASGPIKISHALAHARQWLARAHAKQPILVALFWL